MAQQRGRTRFISVRETLETRTATPLARDQAQDAQKLYDDRASGYDDSWYPRFARHMVELAKIQPGEHVLDLACGTEPVAYAASTAVGPTGSVTGIDISSGMLARTEMKKASHPQDNVLFHNHSITDLQSLPEMRTARFDVVICASALVLLQHPGVTLKHQATYLKPGGRLITDVIHPDSQKSLITFERVSRALKRPLPFYRVPFQGPEDLRVLLDDAGLINAEVILMSQLDINRTDLLEAYRSDLARPRVEKTLTAADADREFDQHIGSWAAKDLAAPDVVDDARRLFGSE